MKNTPYVKNLDPKLYAAMFVDPWELVNNMALNEEHVFWGAGGTAREFAREILVYDSDWSWLVYVLDDYANLVESDMRRKMLDWIWKAYFGNGAMYKRLCDTETVVRWLMDRYTNELKNLFDARYKNHLEAVKFITFEEGFL
jgi:hypothetical protein